MSETHTVTLIKIFAIAINVLPERINSTVSKLKEEKVLNPPQNPAISRILNVEFEPIFSLNTPTINPKTIQLRILEHKVATGNTALKLSFTNS